MIIFFCETFRSHFSYPSHLPITGQEAIKAPKVPHNFLQRFSNNQSSHGLDGTHHCNHISEKNQNKEWERKLSEFKLIKFL